jgi:hypothetical protein
MAPLDTTSVTQSSDTLRDQFAAEALTHLDSMYGDPRCA